MQSHNEHRSLGDIPTRVLDRWLSLYLDAIQTSSGEDYTPLSFITLVTWIRRYRAENGVDFSQLKSTHDTAKCKEQELRDKQLVKHNEGENTADKGITEEIESDMWCRGILGDDSPR